MRDAVDEPRGVGRLIVEEAVVAQQRTHATPLGIEGVDVEGVALADPGLCFGRPDEAVGLSWEVQIAQRVHRPQGSRVYGVFDLGFLRVVLWDDVIAHLAVEVAVCTQHLLRHRCAQGRVDPAEQYGAGAEGGEHPFREAVITADEGVPDPETHLKGRPDRTAAKEGTIGCRGQGSVDFGLCAGEVRVLHGCFILGLGQPREELVAVGDA